MMPVEISDFSCQVIKNTASSALVSLRSFTVKKGRC